MAGDEGSVGLGLLGGARCDRRVVSEAVSPVLAHFLEEADLSTTEIKQLNQLLDEKRSARSAKKPRDKRCVFFGYSVAGALAQ
jgi:hypothetical protein